MLALVAGLLTAVFFAMSTLGSARATRASPAPPAIAGVMGIGALLMAPVAPVTSGPLQVGSPDALAWACLAGMANVGGLLLIYAALRVGAVGIVATIASTEGAIAAVIAVLAGQVLTPAAAGCLAVIVFGVLLAASNGGSEIEDGIVIGRTRSVRSAVLAILAATVFGVGLFAIGRATTALSPAWIVLIGRITGIVLLGLPLLALRRASIPAAARPFVILTGVSEVLGYATYAIGASSNIALTAVLGSMFAPIAAVAAFVLFRERLARRQVAGIVVVVVGVAALAALTTQS